MKKLIKIDNKEYLMKSSAYTQFAYKNETGRSFLSDLQEIAKLKNKDNKGADDLDKITELILKISYVMIQEADQSQVQDYDSFIKGIENLYDNPQWIEDIIVLASTPISRQLQKAQ